MREYKVTLNDTATGKDHEVTIKADNKQDAIYKARYRVTSIGVSFTTVVSSVRL